MTTEDHTAALRVATAFDPHACFSWNDPNCMLVDPTAADALLEVFDNATADPTHRSSTYVRVLFA